jgi:hypothetical protein
MPLTCVLLLALLLAGSAMWRRQGAEQLLLGAPGSDAAAAPSGARRAEPAVATSAVGAARHEHGPGGQQQQQQQQQQQHQQPPPPPPPPPDEARVMHTKTGHLVITAINGRRMGNMFELRAALPAGTAAPSAAAAMVAAIAAAGGAGEGQEGGLPLLPGGVMRGRLLRQIAVCDLDRACTGVAFERNGGQRAIAGGWPANRAALLQAAAPHLPLKVLYRALGDGEGAGGELSCPFGSGCATWAKHSVMAQVRLRGSGGGGGGA